MINSKYPYAGNPRQFVAAAMPQGDRAFGVDGPLVFVAERRGGCVDSPKYLSMAEAAQLRDELSGALRAFEVGAALSDDAQADDAQADDAPRAITESYSFRNHRTVAEIARSEARAV